MTVGRATITDLFSSECMTQINEFSFWNLDATYRDRWMKENFDLNHKNKQQNSEC